MSPEERQQVIDLARLQINEYFDHYLTNTFPQQLQTMFRAHNESVESHPDQFERLDKVEGRVNKATWMIAGVVALLTLLSTVLAALAYWR